MAAVAISPPASGSSTSKGERDSPCRSGATFFARRYRLIATASALDLGLFEKTDPTSRYQRSPFGGCVDTEFGYRVSEFRCSGGTEVIRSLAADVSFVPADNIIIAGKQGRLYTGMGVRLRHPADPVRYPRPLFPRQTMVAPMACGSPSGSNFINLGMSWSIGANRLLGRL